MNTIQPVQLELLQAFVMIVEHEGDATAAAQALGISQPSISRRMTALREIAGDGDDRPWLILKDERRLLTTSGNRVQGVARIEGVAGGTFQRVFSPEGGDTSMKCFDPSGLKSRNSYFPVPSTPAEVVSGLRP